MVKASDLRILSLGLGSALAGNDASVADTARRQVAYGSHFAEYLVIVPTPNRPGIYRPQYLSGTVRVVPTLSDGKLTAVWQMIRIGEQAMRERRFDVVTAQEPFLTGFAGCWLRRRFALPLQIQLHGNYLDNPYWLKEKAIHHVLNPWGKWVLSQANTVRTVNQADERWVRQQFRLSAERVVCAPVRTDLGLFENASGDRVRADYARRGYRHLVLFVGRLIRKKDVATTLRMFAQVAAQDTQTCLVLVGDGKEQAALEAIASDLQIAQRVDFVGFLPLGAVAQYMAAADLIVLSSHLEGFGRVLVEAGAAGRPCVATACPGPSDIIQDGETGYLVPLGDATTMARKVLHLLDNPDLARTMGAQARQHVLEKYDPNRLVMENVESLRKTAELGLRQGK